MQGAPNRIIFHMFPSVYKKLIKLRTLSYVKKGDWVIQAGVDFGVKGKFSNAILLSEHIGENGKVFAIEPDPRNIELLKKYIEKNKINNIEIFEKAVWNESVILTFQLGKKSWWNRLQTVNSVKENEHNFEFIESINVQADTIDNILEDNYKKITHICLTVNGAEYEALQGMKNVLKNEKLSILVVHQKDLIPAENGITIGEKIVSYLKKYNFKTEIGNRWIVATKSC